MEDLLREKIAVIAGKCCASVRRAADPVSSAQVRLWLDAFGVDSAAFLGSPADHTGKQIAPGAMLGAFTGRRLPEWRDNTGVSMGLPDELAAIGLKSIGTGISQEYLGEIIVGDIVVEDTSLESVSERRGTRAGAGYDIVIRTRFMVEERGIVGVQRLRLLAFEPGELGGAKARPRASEAGTCLRKPLPEHRVMLDRMGIITCALACGDFNPAHCDPDIARIHGLEDSFADIYTGLGMAYAFALKAIAAERSIVSLDLSLGAPFYAGDTLTLRGDLLELADCLASIEFTGSCRTGTHIRGSAQLGPAEQSLA